MDAKSKLNELQGETDEDEDCITDNTLESNNPHLPGFNYRIVEIMKNDIRISIRSYVISETVDILTSNALKIFDHISSKYNYGDINKDVS